MYGGTNLGPWPIASWSEDAREAIERRALYEARMTTDFRGAGATPRIGLLARVRDALRLQPASVDACACPA